MKEEDLFKTPEEQQVVPPVQNVQPAQAEEPVVQEQIPIQQEAVQPVIEQVIVKKSSPFKTIFIFIIIIAIIGGGSYGGYYYYSNNINNEPKQTSGVETTTTTEPTTTITTKKEIKLLDIKNIDDYIKYVEQTTASEEDMIAVANLSTDFYDIQYNLYKRCQNDGQEVSYTYKKSKVKFTCKLAEISNDPSWGQKEWIADIVVNDKYKFHKETETTCNTWKEFSNGYYYINYTAGCNIGFNHVFKIEDENNNKIVDGRYRNYTLISESDQRFTPMIIKDNILYYINYDEEDYSENTMTKCSVKYLDLNKENPTEVKLTDSFDCYVPEI